VSERLRAIRVDLPAAVIIPADPRQSFVPRSSRDNSSRAPATRPRSSKPRRRPQANTKWRQRTTNLLSSPDTRCNRSDLRRPAPTARPQPDAGGQSESSSGDLHRADKSNRMRKSEQLLNLARRRSPHIRSSDPAHARDRRLPRGGARDWVLVSGGELRPVTTTSVE
jgi:hypothetical protein